MIDRLNAFLAKVMPWNEFGQRWSIWRTMLIMDRNQPDEVYLKRLRVIQTPLFGFYIHWVYLPDNDRDLHDHPWNFWSLIWRGGYAEHRMHQEWGSWIHEHNVWKRFTLHRVNVREAHKITFVQPNTISVLLIGRRQRDWGFWTDEGWVPWREYKTEGLGPDPFDS